MSLKIPERLRYLKTIGIVNNGFNGRGFANPYDIVVSREGNMFVLNRCDPARRSAIRIGVCNLDEDYLYEFGYGFGDGPGQMVWPVSLAFDSLSRMLVTDEHNNRVTLFTLKGDYVSHWGEGGTGPGQFDGPAGIVIDEEDIVFVADQKNHRIQKYSTDGEFIGQWGGQGPNQGQFDLPWGITIDRQGKVYVADWRNDRVQVFDKNGELKLVIGSPGDGEENLSRPSGVSVDSSGDVYVADWGNERIQVFGPNGEFKYTLRGEATLSQWAIDFFDSNPDEMEQRETSDLEPELPDHLATPYHISSQVEPFFWGPVSVHVDSEDKLYVVESNRHRIQVYEPD